MKQAPTLPRIVAAVERETGFSIDQIKTATGDPQKAARRLLCSLLRHLLKLGYLECATIVGVRRADTAHKACITMDNYLSSYGPGHPLVAPFLRVRSRFTDKPLEAEGERFYVPQ